MKGLLQCAHIGHIGGCFGFGFTPGAAQHVKKCAPTDFLDHQDIKQAIADVDRRAKVEPTHPQIAGVGNPTGNPAAGNLFAIQRQLIFENSGLAQILHGRPPISQHAVAIFEVAVCLFDHRRFKA